MKNSSHVLFTSFNQDFGCFACGLDDGFRIYNCDPLKENHQEKFSGGIGAIEMLFRCNYVALVGGGPAPAFPTNHVIIWDVTQHKEVIRLEMSGDVRGVRLRRDRIVVVLDASVHVFSFTDQPEKLHVFDSGRNPSGICCLCPSSRNSLLVFPSPSSSSTVLCLSLAEPDAPPKIIHAHQSPLSAIALDSSGDQLATSSEKGTIIRIFNTATCALLRELRRGSHSATIFCMNFSPDSNMLCVSSNHSTVHLFSLAEKKRTRLPLRKLSLCGEVSISRFQLPFPSKGRVFCLCAFGPVPNSVIAISLDGNYFKFNFYPERGQCIKQTCSLYLEMSSSGER